MSRRFLAAFAAIYILWKPPCAPRLRTEMKIYNFCCFFFISICFCFWLREVVFVVAFARTALFILAIAIFTLAFGCLTFQVRPPARLPLVCCLILFILFGVFAIASVCGRVWHSKRAGRAGECVELVVLPQKLR